MANVNQHNKTLHQRRWVHSKCLRLGSSYLSLTNYLPFVSLFIVASETSLWHFITNILNTTNGHAIYIKGIVNFTASPTNYVKPMKPCTLHTKNSTHINTWDLNPGPEQ